jgi:hypothetical protein
MGSRAPLTLRAREAERTNFRAAKLGKPLGRSFAQRHEANRQAKLALILGLLSSQPKVKLPQHLKVHLEEASAKRNFRQAKGNFARVGLPVWFTGIRAGPPLGQSD